MTKRALPLLTGGLNEITRSDLIDDSQLQQCLNYEIEGDGTLVLRTEPEQFDSTLDVLLSELYSTVSKISEPWYPQTLQDYSGISRSDYFLFAFGETVDEEGSPTGIYELHILWEYDGEWTNIAENENGIIDNGNTLADLLSDADIVYTSDSQVEIVIGTDRVIITDGINRAHSIALDEDGIVRSGILGIPAPQNKPRVIGMDTFRDELWETDSTASYISTPGLFQCNYTVVTDIGEESNPSPLSDTLDMQFFQLDEDGIDERWLEKVEIKDLSIPSVSENILDTLRYFKVYVRVIKYSDGESAAVMEFSKQYLIISKKDSDGNILLSGTTGNDYTVTVAPTAGDIVSYENDVAPIAKTGAETGGITMLGNVKTKINFPWEFKYFHKIAISNEDSNNYVDAIIKIRLWDKDAVGTGTNAIDNFTVTDFVDTDATTISKEHIRIFDQDLTTPIMVCYNGYNNSDDVNISGDGDYVDLYIKIPLLTSGSSHFIYLCWTPVADQGNYAGVPGEDQTSGDELDESVLQYHGLKGDDTTWQGSIGMHYGRFHVIGSQSFNLQQVWKGVSLQIDNPVLCDFNLGFINRYDANDEVEEEDATRIDSMVKIPVVGETLSGQSIQVNDSSIVSFAPPTYVDTPFPEKGIVFFNFIPTGTVGSVDSFNSVFTIGTNLFGLFVDSAGNVDWGSRETGYIQGSAPDVSLDYRYSNIDSYFVAYSWDRGDEKRSIFVYNIGDGISGNSFHSSEGTEIEASSSDTLFSTLTLDRDDGKYDNVSFVFGRYFSAGNTEDDAAVQNMANFMPAFDVMIGYNYDTNNNNITFSDTEEVKFKDNKNLVKWTDVYFSSFPDLFFKKVREPVLKIMPAPSFLQFEYQNTFIIFTRNSINRFILSGSADGWSGSSSSLIEEKTQYGLLAPESLVRAGDALFWLSEVGVMMWQKDGLGLISKNIVDIPIEEDVIGFYNNLKNQYILHRNVIIEQTNQSITYVFHIERNSWSRFTNLDIVDISSLTAGSELDNVSLFLESDGTIKKYPTSTATSTDALIETKEIFFEKGILRRIKAGFEGDGVDFISHLKKADSDGLEVTKTNTITSIETDKWRGIALANSRGKSVSFKIKNAEKIQSIMYDLNIESEVVV